MRFALSCVPKDGHHLQQLVRAAAQALHKRAFVFYLWTERVYWWEYFPQNEDLNILTVSQMTHLHFLILVHQEKTGHLYKFCFLRFSLTGYLYGGLDRCRGRVDLSRFGRWRIRGELVFLLITSTVGAFLTVLAQVNFAVLAADHRPVPLAVVSIASFTVVTVGDVTWTYLNPLVVLQTLLTVELKLTPNTLQTSAFVTFIRSLLGATARITFLAYQTCIDSLFWGRAMPTHRFYKVNLNTERCLLERLWLQRQQLPIAVN